jgi:hypothetical protein
MSGDSRPNVANITGPQLATPSISFHQANHVPINAQTVNVQHFSHHNVPAISCVPIKKRKEDTGARKSSNMHHARQSRSHEQSVINRINEQLGELSSRNLKEQWMSSIKEPIDFISKRFQRLQLDGRPVQVRERVGNADVDKLHCKLKTTGCHFLPDHTRLMQLFLPYLTPDSCVALGVFCFFNSIHTQQKTHWRCMSSGQCGELNLWTLYPRHHKEYFASIGLEFFQF